jgi:ATP-binding cassette subfamily C protein CydC
MKNFWRLVKMTLPLKGWVVLATLLGLATIAAGVGLMATSAYMISAAALHPSVAALSLAVVGVRFFGIARGVFRYLERYVTHHLTFRLLARWRVWFYRAVEPLAPARLSKQRSGDLLSRVISDIETLQNFYGRVLAPPLVAALAAIGMWILLGAFNPLFAATLLFFYFLAGVGVPLLAYGLGNKVSAEIVVARGELNALMVDSLQGMAEIVAFGRENDFELRLADANKRLIKLQNRANLVNALQNSLGTFLMNLAVWVMLIVAIPFVRDGSLNGVYLALLALASLASFEAIMPLPQAAQQLGGSLEAGRRLYEIADSQPPTAPANSEYTPVENYSIEFDHVRFRYEENEPEVLAGINFRLKEGDCLALVGPSGAGKSSVGNLLLRFWNYQEGHIRLGGRELRDMPQDEIINLIGVVSQHTHLFNTSIRQNLLIARPKATQEELEAAAKMAQIHDFIMSLPKGYDTQAGEMGLKLSGGERQRLAIARAFLKDAPILLLDEATANLDTLTEQEVLKSLDLLRKGRTTILITHRLTGLEMADEIIALREGKVVERGTHKTLLLKEGLYWSMWERQNQALYAA